MNDTQKNHIRTNLDKLIELTSPSPMLLAKLQAQEVLTENEHQFLRAISNKHEANQHLYELLQTRKHAYGIMKQILLEEKQSGAFDIFAEADHILQCPLPQLIYDKNDVLGRGCQNTRVYRGRFDNIMIAVKVINCDDISMQIAMKEIRNYTKLSAYVNQNIIRYYTAVEQNGFLYIALELCDCSLAECIKERKLSVSIPDILLQTTKGLHFLHENGILHLDLKPENVLLKIISNNGVVIKISDLGIARQITEDDQSVLMLDASSGLGTFGWMAPEIQTVDGEGRRKAAKAADIFSLGCVFYFSIANGNHAFGDEIHCRANIADAKPEMDTSYFKGKYIDHYRLINCMISHEAADRPHTSHILNHPAFWSVYTTLKFISDIKSFIRCNTEIAQTNFKKCKESLISLNQDEDRISTNQWLHRLSDVVRNYLVSSNCINSEHDMIEQIVTTISKLFKEYNRLPSNVKESLGNIPEGFLLYWTTKFPFLVWILWAHFENLKHEPRLSCYYDVFHSSFSSWIPVTNISTFTTERIKTDATEHPLAVTEYMDVGNEQNISDTENTIFLPDNVARTIESQPLSNSVKSWESLTDENVENQCCCPFF